MNFGLLLRKYKKIFILIFTLIIGLSAGTAWISRTEVTEADAGLRYYAFDVGQGDSSLLSFPTERRYWLMQALRTQEKNLLKNSKSSE